MTKSIDESYFRSLSDNLVVDLLIQSAICRALPRNSYALVNTLPQSVIATLLDASGISYGMVVNEKLLYKYGPKLYEMFKPTGLGFTCLGEQSYCLEMVPRVEAGFSNLAKAPESIYVQSVDEAFIGLQKISWLALDKTNLEFLRGARQCIIKHRPLISLDFTENVDDLLQWCKTYGYEAFEASLARVTTASMSSKYYLFPSTWLLESVASYLFTNQSKKAEFKFTSNESFNKWHALCNTGDRLAKLTRDYLSRGNNYFPLQNILATALYPTEFNEISEWRWTGPGYDTNILLPLPANGLYRVSFTIFALPEGQKTNHLRCFINGVLFLSKEVVNNSKIKFEYFTNESDSGLPTEMQLSVNKVSNHGGRELGIAISNIQVEWILS